MLSVTSMRLIAAKLSGSLLSQRARNAAKTSGFPKGYWRWEEMLAANESGFFPYTPATNLLYGLREALIDH